MAAFARGEVESMVRLLVPDDGAPIHLVRHDESDFRIRAGRYRDDFGVGCELVRSESGVEHDRILAPEWIEPITLDRIDHRGEVLLLIEVVRRMDLVDAPFCAVVAAEASSGCSFMSMVNNAPSYYAGVWPPAPFTFADETSVATWRRDGAVASDWHAAMRAESAARPIQARAEFRELIYRVLLAAVTPERLSRRPSLSLMGRRDHGTLPSPISFIVRGAMAAGDGRCRNASMRD